MQLTAIAKRLLIAAIAIPLVLLCVVHDQGMLFITCLLSFVGMREFVLMRTQVLFPQDPPKDSSEHVIPPRLHSLSDNVQMYVRCSMASLLCASGYVCSSQLLPTAPVLHQGLLPFLFSLHSSFLFLTVTIVIFLVLWTGSMFEWLHAGSGADSNDSAVNSGAGTLKKQFKDYLRKEDLLAVMFDFCGCLYTGGALSFALMLTRVNKSYMALILLANWACDASAMFCGKQQAAEE